MPEPNVRVTPQRWKAEVTLHSMETEPPEFGRVVLVWSFSCVCWMRAAYLDETIPGYPRGVFRTEGVRLKHGDVEFWADLPPVLDDLDLPDPMEEMPEPGENSKRWRWLGDEMGTHLLGTFPENWGWTSCDDS